MKKLAVLLVAVLAVAALAGCSGGGVEKTMSLYVLNWGDYIEEGVLEGFRQEYPHIDMHYDTMTSNEEMLIRLQSADSIYDLCFPSDYAITKLIKEDLLAEIDTSRLTNYKNLDPRFLNREFDPENKYSVPYFWGTFGIMYNTKMVTEPVESWDILWDEKYKDQIYMYDSVRDSMMIALLRLGYANNTTNPDEIAEAEALLKQQKPIVAAYGTDDLRDRMVAESGALAAVYNGDAYSGITMNPDLAYVVPVEGSNIWFDNMVIPKSSKNKDAAYLFIDYLLRADIAAINADYVGYSTPNAAAMELLDEEMIQDEVYNPSQEVIDRCTPHLDLGEHEKLYHDAWTRLKAY
ncbi:MAG: ABC transporter substrate-binding protein [Christensenellales bacterium]|jgi:spermidine/putrescine-binding protein